MKSKVLVLYYSRTNTTKELCESIAKEMNADTEEIKEPTSRKGAVAYIMAGKEALFKETPEIYPIESKLNNYDQIIIGTPNWAGHMASPVRTFINDNRQLLKSKTIAFVCTQGSKTNFAQPVLSEMAQYTEKEPKATLILPTKTVKKNEYAKVMEDFIVKMRS